MEGPQQSNLTDMPPDHWQTRVAVKDIFKEFLLSHCDSELQPDRTLPKANLIR